MQKSLRLFLYIQNLPVRQTFSIEDRAQDYYGPSPRR